MNKGLFIVLEGGEGSGKTTLASKLSASFNKDNISNILTREPGGVEVAEDIRSVIMNYDLNPKSEALLFAAARCEHLNQKVLPALNLGTHVICDRYIDSSVVYQGFTKGLTTEYIYDLNLWVTDNFLPNITFFLDIDPKIGLSRIANNNRETNRFDDNDIEFHNTLRKGYLELFKDRANSYIIDASKSPDEIYQEVMNIIKGYING